MRDAPPYDDGLLSRPHEGIKLRKGRAKMDNTHLEIITYRKMLCPQKDPEKVINPIFLESKMAKLNLHTHPNSTISQKMDSLFPKMFLGNITALLPRQLDKTKVWMSAQLDYYSINTLLSNQGT